MRLDAQNGKKGNIVTGRVISLEPKGALVDIGDQTVAYLPWQEMSIDFAENPLQVLQFNEIREFLLLSEQDEVGHEQVFLSLRQLEEKRAWERLRQMQAEDVTVYSKVIATNTNKVLVKIEGLVGSIHRSDLVGNKSLEAFIAEVLPLKFYQVDENNKCLILSHKKALLIPQMKQLRVGEVVTGNILEVKHFGVFIDIGEAIALLRLPEISHAHFDSPHDIFQVNDQVKAMIYFLDFERGIISLSTKALEPEPGDMLKNPQLVYEKAEETAARSNFRQ